MIAITPLPAYLADLLRVLVGRELKIRYKGSLILITGAL
jgi:hypothetical protein